jgi:hypothetical protein
MPSLIGNKPNQVPSNGDLGTMAFREQDQFYSTQQSLGLKNRIINGAMVIDQRNAGASVAIANNTTTYTLDRWMAYYFTDGAFSVQQTSVAPSGFTNSLRVTVTTADASLASNQYGSLQQRIEGFNASDLMYGTANAQTTTLSFWVRSSVTGQYGGSFTNSNFSRSYPFSYTINAADTWEQKTITVPGDTTGTWDTTNGTGIRISFALGVGSNNVGTANAWASATLISATGQVNMLGTSGATFYITGVQLEKGSTATSFDYRPYGTELALCQRYYYKIKSGKTGTGAIIGVGAQTSTTGGFIGFVYPVVMRAAPTASFSSLITSDGASYDATVSSINLNATNDCAYLDPVFPSAGATYRPMHLRATSNTSGFLDFSAEL